MFVNINEVFGGNYPEHFQPIKEHLQYFAGSRILSGCP